uniref:Myozenin 2b n=1 Tax=Oreochromis niloticus TaxID=8128 RepID=A0A669DQ09_ORENI
AAFQSQQTQRHTHSLALVSRSVKIREDQTTYCRLTPEPPCLLFKDTGRPSQNDILNVNTHTVEIKVEPPANGNIANAEKKDSVTTTEKLNPTATHKSYHSPWEEALLRDPSLAETLKLKMPAADPRPELPEYKCFNRVATPFGGFEKVSRGITFKLPEVDLNPPRYPELQDAGLKRPTFNRTAQGWISEGTHLILPTITLEPISVPESDDL